MVLQLYVVNIHEWLVTELDRGAVLDSGVSSLYSSESYFEKNQRGRELFLQINVASFTILHTYSTVQTLLWSVI